LGQPGGRGGGAGPEQLQNPWPVADILATVGAKRLFIFHGKVSQQGGGGLENSLLLLHLFVCKYK